ncbi:MAG: hypothetical protein CSA22_10665 [Deltaproteobacteria bacterium]|nr:MAG: hypothetical protein CSA22_10665 [Deltaproteobacteria bacterium]
MHDPSKTNPVGIATLFEHIELKDFFKNYLILIGVIEILIFFVCLLTTLGPSASVYPWRSYFFAAIVIPTAMTFLLGVVIISFNRFLFGQDTLPAQPPVSPADASPSVTDKFNLLMRAFRQVPLMLGLLLLGVFAGIIYKIDAIIHFASQAGERVVQYLLISIGCVLMLGSILLVLWLILNYRLRKTSMANEFQFKNEVVKQTGLIILNDQTVVTADGAPVNIEKQQQLGAPENKREARRLLPRFK